MPSREDDVVVQLREENARLVQRVSDLEALNERLESRIADLEAELSRHSGNSSKPPSSDTLTQRAAQKARREGWRKKKRRRPGKQPGAKGRHLAQVAVPDVVVRHVPQACETCGASLARAADEEVEVRQVFDIPEPKVSVTEHRSIKRRCRRCGSTTSAPFPSEASAPASWGPQTKALAIYLMVRQHLPVARTAELLTDVLGAPVSTGFLAGLTQQAAGGLDPFIRKVRDALVSSEVLNVDETGARISGERQWFHVVSTDLFTLIDCDHKRGAEATDRMGVLPDFEGVAVHDRWQPYFSYDCTHAICGAHLLRDLAAVAELGRQEAWAEAMAKMLLDTEKRAERAVLERKPALSRRQLGRIEARYDEAVAEGLRVNIPLPRNYLERKALNLAVAFRDHKDEVLRFAADLRVPFDNNQAERDLRMVKLQQKISGCFRTVEGAKAFCALRSYIQTAAKNGKGALEVLAQLCLGRPWMPSLARAP